MLRHHRDRLGPLLALLVLLWTAVQGAHFHGHESGHGHAHECAQDLAQGRPTLDQAAQPEQDSEHGGDVDESHEACVLCAASTIDGPALIGSWLEVRQVTGRQPLETQQPPRACELTRSPARGPPSALVSRLRRADEIA